MTETRTTRFNLPQWSAGTDTGSRTDFDGAFAELEARAAYDDGTTAADLPLVNLVAGRYFRRSYSDGYALYRHSATAWEWMGGTVAPSTLRYRAANDAAVAFMIDQGGIGSAKLIAYGNGDIATSGSVWANYGAFGTDGDAYAAAETGHLYTEANTGERGIVVRARAADAGYLFAARDAGGSVVTSVDALGRLQQRTASSFGGASLSATSMMTVAPTGVGGDGNTNGLLLHGQAAADTKTILSIQRDIADTAPIALFERDRITIGRLPWGSDSALGNIRLTGRNTAVRGIGWPTPNNRSLFSVYKVDNADPNNAALEKLIFHADWDTVGADVPMYLSNAHTPAQANLTLYNKPTHTARFLELYRQIDVSTFHTKALWDSDGRLQLGVPWVGTSTLRDARQPIRHTSFVRFGGYPTGGVDIKNAPNSPSTHVYTWPTMTSHSVSAFDLAITTLMEIAIVGQAGAVAEDGQFFTINTAISVNGGAFTSVGSNQIAAGANPTGHVLPAVTTTHIVHARDLPAGATFQLRTTITNGNAAPWLDLQAYDISAQECLIHNYVIP